MCRDPKHEPLPEGSTWGEATPSGSVNVTTYGESGVVELIVGIDGPSETVVVA